MSAYHKALKVVRRTVNQEFSVECSNSNGVEWTGNPSDCRGTIYIDDACGHSDLSKFDFVAMVKDGGWTYDKSGNWLCPTCSKEGE